MRKDKLNQSGIVSLVITVILMVVITLVVLSFAKISRREQRNALDRQLSTQAFYAAESGVNDARNALESWSDTDARFADDYMTECDSTDTDSFAHTTNGNIPQGTPLAGSGQAAYTCVFVDASPVRLIYSVSDDQHVIPLRNKSGGALNTLELYWDNGTSGGFTDCQPPSAGNPLTWYTDCDAPILRIELVDASNAAGLTTSKTFFVYPSINQSDALDFVTSQTGQTARAPCAPAPNRPNRCFVQITGMNSDRYYARVSGLYLPLALTITANNGTSELVGAQSLIDVTGRASDVERRIQVRVKLGDQSNNLPLFGVAATDKICKRFDINGSTGTDRATPLCWSAATTPN